MKHSFVALFSVLTCIVYGQLPANWNHHPYGFRHYVAQSPSALRNVVNSPIAAEPGEQPETRNQVLLMTQISMLELTIDELAKEFRKKLSDSEAKVEALTNRLNAFTCTCSADTPKTINEIPSSCADLKGVGNTRSGLYSVMGRKQVEIVYCDFTKPTGDFGFQKWIGYQDVKSKPVYFYVQKTQHFSTLQVPMPFERVIINKGNGMVISTGKFTAPVKGTYYFSFTGLVQFSVSTAALSAVNVFIYHNAVAVGRTQLAEVNGIRNPNHLSPITVQATLKLQEGDEVWLQCDYISGGFLYDTAADRGTHFQGWLLEEEIDNSL